MQHIVQYIQRAVKTHEPSAETRICVECNFDNDYYGDQICVGRPVKINNAI